VPPDKSLVGLIVIAVVPVPVTCASPTAIVATVELSEVFLIVMLPDSTSTASLKFRTILAFAATLAALSAGVDEDRVGAVVSVIATTSVDQIDPICYCSGF